MVLASTTENQHVCCLNRVIGPYDEVVTVKKIRVEIEVSC